MADRLAPPVRLVIVRHVQDRLPDWQAMLLDRLANDPLIELVGILDGKGPAPVNRQGKLLRVILGLERLIVGRQLLSYDKTKARALLTALPVVSRVQGPPVADLALELGAQGLAADQLTGVSHGAWSVTFGGARFATDVASKSSRRAAAGMEVQILSRGAASPEPSLVRAAQYNLKPGAVLTGAFVEEKSVLLVCRALQDFALKQGESVRTALPLPTPTSTGVVEAIGYAGYFVKAVLRKLKERTRVRRGLAPKFWRLSAGTSDVIDMDPRQAVALPALRHTMADPFLFEHGGKTWVFYEAMNADEGAGWIDVAELDGDTLKSNMTALACPYHLSFPFVFRDGDDIFMLPETQQSRRLEVWRATDFPTKWVRHATGFEGMYLADSTLWKAPDQQWWLLTNVSDHHAFQDHSSELYLFAVDGPSLGSVTPHPGNPVAIGADHARNAGALIVQNGRLFRPSQNNSYGVYGYGLNLMEITRLDATTFEESLVRRWTPDDCPGVLGLHHLSAAAGRYVFDWNGS